MRIADFSAPIPVGEGDLHTTVARNGSAPKLLAADPFRASRHYLAALKRHGMSVHYLEPCEGVVGPNAQIDGRDYVSFSTYNYLGYSGDSRVTAAACEALQRYGTSVSASRLVAGERPIHRELEREIARLTGADDSLVYVSGHATNVSTLACLFGPKVLILYDELSHNSIRQGIRLSGAAAYRFSHNDCHEVDALLQKWRGDYQRALIVTEGVFSMDGDIAPVPDLVEIKRRHHAFLMVDEAHSMGVIGSRGLGISDYYLLDGGDVDLWMGTLSKALASCGGYIAGRHDLVESLRYAAPGFVYACGISPPNAAAALAAARLMQQEPERVRQIAENVRAFKTLADNGGLDTGVSGASAVVPIILGCSLTCLFAAHLLYKKGILVFPLFYPIVPKNAARLRFFLTALHSAEEIQAAIDATIEAVNHARSLAALELARD